MIYADSEFTLVPKDNDNLNLHESCMNKYKNNAACTYGNELISVDDNFSKPFNSYLSADAVYNFKYFSQEFDSNVLDLVNQKVFYPYVYMSDFEKFKELLLSKEKFYSLVTGKKIKSKKYKHGLEVWKKFEMKMMKHDHELHLKCDVLLLAYVFEKFRNNSLNNYGLSPSHYLNAPVLSWDVMLNMTKVGPAISI